MYLFKIISSILVMLLLNTHCWALRSDRDQPIDIKADRVEINEKTETSHYQGNVHLQQGTMQILADTVTVHLKEGKLTLIVIDGTPATFVQQPEDNKDIVQSSAKHMEYFASKELLVLKNAAKVVQGANHFSGDFIEYDTLNSTVKANKNESSTSRVHAIIQPAKDKDNVKATPSPGTDPTAKPAPAPSSESINPAQPKQP